jgi:hypothetical protein
VHQLTVKRPLFLGESTLDSKDYTFRAIAVSFAIITLFVCFSLLISVILLLKTVKLNPAVVRIILCWGF